MTIGNAGSKHREECSWWGQGPKCLEQLQEWKQWVQYCHASGDSKSPECITVADGMLSIRAESGQQLLKLDMGTGNVLETTTDKPVKAEPRTQVETSCHDRPSPRLDSLLGPPRPAHGLAIFFEILIPF